MKIPRKKWFVASLVVSSRVDDGTTDSGLNSLPLVDMQYRLISADDAEAAYIRAMDLGREEDHDYLNDAGARVYWEFAGLNDLHEIDTGELRDGVELFSRIDRTDPGRLALPKERLEVFWSEANKDRTAADILDSDDA